MKLQLQEWYRQWLEEYKDSNKIYARVNGEASLPQAHFVRDVLPSVIWGNTWSEVCDQHVTVIGEHTSKSVRLPVYGIEVPHLGLRLVMRYNYFDWNASIISERPIEADLQGFETAFGTGQPRAGWCEGDSWGYCFFQGFPPEYCFGPWVLNSRKFSLCIEDNYNLFTFVWLITRYLRAGA